MEKQTIKRLATEIKTFLDDNFLNGDCRIYFNGMCWEHDMEDDPFTYDAESREYLEIPVRTSWKTISNINPRRYFVFANGVISMSFEGSFYYVINPWYADFPKTFERYNSQFSNLLKKYNCYYEPGDAWNLSIYEE